MLLLWIHGHVSPVARPVGCVGDSDTIPFLDVHLVSGFSRWVIGALYLRLVERDALLLVSRTVSAC